MPELIALARACVSLGFCVLILIYVIKLLRRLGRTTVVAGRLFLAAERLRKVNVAIFTGLILVYMFTVTLLVENYVVRELEDTSYPYPYHSFFTDSTNSMRWLDERSKLWSISRNGAHRNGPNPSIHSDVTG